MFTNSYLCPSCSKPYKATVNLSDPFGTTQQQNWLKKHTSASTRYEIQSVLESNGTEYVLGAIREAVDNGFIEETYRGTNILYTPSAGSCLGNLYNKGIKTLPLDTLKVAKTSSHTQLHLMADQSSKYKDKLCNTCGEPVQK